MRITRTIVIAWLTACAPNDNDRVSVSPTVTDSAGVRIVLNAQPQFTSLALEETLRLGRVDGEGPELFAGVIPVSLDSAGNIFVGNKGSTTVRVFDKGGAFLAEFGGKGEGPSELTSLDRVVAGADTIVLVDFQRRIKVALFALRGDFIDSRVVPTVEGIRMVPIIHSDRGWIWARVYEQVPNVPAGGAADLVARYVISDFEAPESAGVVNEAATMTFYGTDSGPAVGLFSQASPIGFDELGRMYVPSRNAYRIDLFQDRRLVGSVRRDIKPRPITKEDVDQLRSAVIDVIDTISSIPDAMRAGERRSIAERHDQKAVLPLPPVASPVQHILVSRDGSFWVQREADSLAQSEAEQMFNHIGLPSHETEWDLFDNRGFFIGSVRLPARFRADAVSGTTVVGVAAGEYDVEYVVRFNAVGRN